MSKKYSMDEIAEMLNITKETVRRVLVRAGYTPPAPHEVNEKYCTDAHVRDIAHACRELPYCATASCRYCMYERCVIMKHVPMVCTFYKPKEVTA